MQANIGLVITSSLSLNQLAPDSSPAYKQSLIESTPVPQLGFPIQLAGLSALTTLPIVCKTGTSKTLNPPSE
eukprot:363900-Chlamydomonas_euryale.AAC.6